MRLGMNDVLDREEAFSMTVLLDSRTEDNFPNEVATLKRATKTDDVTLKGGNCLRVDYEFSILYMNGLVAILDAFLKLMEGGKFVFVDAKELKHGRSVAKEFFVKLGEIEKALAKADDAADLKEKDT